MVTSVDIKKDDIKSAAEALMPLLDSKEPKDWPVLHTPMLANIFPLSYVYSFLLLLRICCGQVESYKDILNIPKWGNGIIPPKHWTDESVSCYQAIMHSILEKKIRCKDWGEEPPELDWDARFNIFFSNSEQKKEWSFLGDLHAFKIFKYTHHFFLGDGSPKGETTLDDWIKDIEDFTEIRIVTDIEAQAGLLRNHILKELSKSNLKCKNISIALSSKREPTDVLNWAFFDKGKKTLKRVFLLGTPLCEILKKKNCNYSA